MGADTLNSAINTLFGIDKSKKTPQPNRMGDLEHFTVHDLRRTFRSLSAGIKFRGDVYERCLNHKISNLDDTYNKLDYFEERQTVHSSVCDKLSSLLKDHFH